MTRALVIGSGGREHALAWKLAQSPEVDDVVAAPGNVGIAEIGECLAVRPDDPRAVADLAERVAADLVVVGPEDPCVAGVVDAVEARGRLAFGPRAGAARLEGSKAWMKEVLAAAGVPTARHRTFTADQVDLALEHLDTLQDTWVIKPDGLTAGKGVVVTDSLAIARATVRDYLSGASCGPAGTTCVIEEGMVGPELSLFALCDGTDASFVGCVQDHKRVGDGDTGPNTGGMGAYTPVPFATDELVDEVMVKIVRPTLEELVRRDADYRGVLFCGLMLTPEGPKVLEYNVRFGDPECQALVRRLDSDLFVHLLECATGSIRTRVRLRDDAAVALWLAADGYPAAPRTGDHITGLERARALHDVEVFVAGAAGGDGGDRGMVTAGGRVLCVTATGPDLRSAVDTAYRAAGEIHFDGMHYRHDIAAQGLP
jgi:phosphoribosylamine--glycine ligase